MASLLLVEDEHSISDLYKIKFEANDFVVHQCFNGLEAWDYIQKNPIPDAILLDLKMPIMSGEEFLSKLRNVEKYQDIPVVILTNISREEAPKTIWHYGISGYFVKASHTPMHLVEIINTTLRKQT